VNIFLGSVLATIGLTVPAMLIISRLVGRNMILGVEGPDRVMLLLTLAVSMVTFSSGRTNVLQGAVHLVLFAAYLLLMVQG
jgi:Ca2+:H+ antiporter